MASNTEGSTLTALVVEDTLVDRLILSRMLQMLHVETTVAMNGKEAVDLFHKGKTFDIVFCDKDMPVMTGPEAIVLIRAMGATEVKIVGVSADVDARLEFISAGADDFVPKPVKVAVLEDHLEDVLRKKNNGVA